MRSTVRDANLCVHKCERCGVKRGAKRRYRDGKPDASRSHVKRRAPLGFVARGIEFRMTAVAIRRCWLSVICALSRHALMLRAPKRPWAISQSLSTMASKIKSLDGGPKRRQHLSKKYCQCHRVKCKLTERRDILNNIISELIQKERGREWS